MPSADTNEEAGRFGAGDGLILVVVPVVAAELVARLAGKGSLADSELEDWVLDSGSPLAEEKLPALVRSLSAAFADEWVDAGETAGR
jgi:hypothetical protein